MEVQDRINLFIKREGFEPQAYEVCPRFDKCSCNRCPLDSNINFRTYAEIDNEKRCKMTKKIRKEIGIYFNLLNKGLTKREISGAKSWDSLSQEEKEARTEKIKKIGCFYRLSEKGYVITPKNKSQVKNTELNNLKSLKTGVQE